MAFRYVVPALAAASRVAAQCSGTTTIQNSGDASAIASCQTYSGSITIATSTSDDIDFSGSLRKIDGSLTAQNVPNMTTLSADSLEEITDSFTLDTVSALSTLNFPQLTNVDTVDWIGLPSLQGLSFTTGLQMVTSLSIQNTQLGSLEGINLQEVDTFFVANNPFLNTISMQLGSIGQSMSLEANGRDVQASFPNLEWAYNMTMRNVTTVDIPSLASVNGSLGFYANFFTSFAAPNLTSVGGTLAFVSNEDLTNVTFPELKTVGGALQLANNTELKQITGFPSVTTVSGAVDANGNFTSLQLPKLNVVKGAMNLQSSEDITDVCNHFSPLVGSNNVIRGKFFCKGYVAHPGGVGTGSGSSTGSGSGSSSSSSSPAVPIHISGATGVLGVMAAIFGML